MGALELRRAETPPAFYLDGRRIDAGAVLELRMHGPRTPRWMPGAFKWDGDADADPFLVVTFARGGAASDRVEYDLCPELDVLRWPAEQTALPLPELAAHEGRVMRRRGRK